MTASRQEISKRLQEAARLVFQHIGLAYLALWAVTYWALGHGVAVLTGAGCRVAANADLFVWSCSDDAGLRFLADFVNGVLGITVWAPWVVAAGMAQPALQTAAIAVILLHLVGLPAALLIVIRLGERLCDRAVGRVTASPGPSDAALLMQGPCVRRALPAPKARPGREPVVPRKTFGLRGSARPRPGSVGAEPAPEPVSMVRRVPRPPV